MARTAGSVGEVTAASVRAAALTLFARTGYHAVSMRAIAGAVGVQPGALYNHFPTKQSILVHLMRAHMEEVLAHAAEALSEDGSAEDRLRRFTRFHIRHHLPRAEAVFLSSMELRSLEPEGFREIEALRTRYEDILVEILRAGARDGSFAIADPRIAAMAIIAMLTAIPSWYRPDGRLAAAEVEDIHIDMVAGSVGLAVHRATAAA